MANGTKYQSLISNVIAFAGGKDNISYFTYCTTRLRFNIKDKGAVHADKIAKLDGVLGTQWTGNQLQVIVGQDVADVYKLICKTHGIKSEAKIDENLDTHLVKEKKKKFSVRDALTAMSACIIPLIPMLVAGGMIKSVILALSFTNILPQDSNTYFVFNFVADASLYFLPVALGYSCSKRFNMETSIGIMLGAVLIHPNFISAVNDSTAMSVFGLSVPLRKYSSTIFPMFITMFVASYVEKFLKKHLPSALKPIFVPTLTIVIMTPVMLCFLAPLGSILGSYLGVGIKWIYDTFGALGPALFAAFSPFLVMTGMHAALAPYSTNAIATTGKDIFVGPAAFIRNFNQGVAALVVAVKSKDVEQRSIAISCAITAIVSGITEPALFGVNLKYRKPLYASCIGGFFGGLYAGLTGVARYAYGGSGLFGLVVFIGENPYNLLNEVIAMAIGGAVTFIVGMFIVKPEELVDKA